MPLLKIDDREVEVAAGTTVLDAALANDIEIPHYCYHPVWRLWEAAGCAWWKLKECRNCRCRAIRELGMRLWIRK
jgi:predicted molibdopterin-dependent oxidoreductase YjgC